MFTLEKACDEIAKRALEKRRVLAERVSCLWPAPFDTPDAETAYRFLLELRTWNEAASEVQAMPDRAYLCEYVREWWGCFQAGRPLCMEKCRRMVISWAARGLELFVMGLGRCDQILVGEDLEAAAKHVWRLKHLYEDLAKRRPEWRLPACKELRYEGDRKLKQFGLTNGSTCSYANGQASGLQGEGVRIITMEEFGIYRYGPSMLAQAKIVTKNTAGATGGFVNIITNSSVDPEWQRIKRGGLDEAFVPALSSVVAGLEATELQTGMRYLKLHYYADPEKDMDWLQRIEQEMLDTPRDFRLQILMDDREDDDALWMRSDIDNYRVTSSFVDELELLKVVVALDPSTKDEPGHDEMGIVVAAVAMIDEELHGLVMVDASGKYDPEKAARLVVGLAQRAGASEIVYEGNQGGDWIKALIRAEFERQKVLLRPPLVEVSCFRGKILRAEPVAAKYRQGLVHHVRAFPELESQMTRWNPLAARQSPDRLDALVIALTRLFGSGVGMSFKSDEVYRRRGRGVG